MSIRARLCSLALAASAVLPQARAQGAPPPAESLVIDAAAATTPFPHFWEQTFGSGRAVLSLREDYRHNLDAVRAVTDFSSVRAHGILNDDVGLYDPDRMTKNPGQAAVKAGDRTSYNFSYVDQIYDGLLEHHVRPFVELSFMPKKMASKPDAVHPFWYHPNVSPPADFAQWDAMMHAFAEHLIARYGLEEVATWSFEVWNEPNLDFWGGDPKQPTYFELYDHTARDLKAVSPRLRIGGPATAQAGWVTPFLAHVAAQKVPVDFVSTHVYANDNAQDVFKTSENIPRDKMVSRSVQKVHQEIMNSPLPRLPLIFSEYNASYANEPNVTDSAYMGPWLANNIRLCDGLTESMAYWDFSDVFEEQGVPRTPFYGGFGLLAERSIPKPVFNAFAMLHQLGDRRLALKSDSALATRTAGGLAVALWNYAPPDGTGAAYTPPPATRGPAKQFILTLRGVPAAAKVTLLRVDEEHGNVIAAFDRMGRPDTPSRDQITELRKAGAMSAPETMQLDRGTLKLNVPEHGLALVLIDTK